MFTRILPLFLLLSSFVAFAELEPEKTKLPNTGAVKMDFVFGTKIPAADFLNSISRGEAETTIMTNASINVAAHYLIDQLYLGADAELNEINIMAVLALLGGGVSLDAFAPNDISISLQAGYNIIRKADQLLAVIGSVEYNPEFTGNGTYHNIGGGVALKGMFPFVEGSLVGVKVLGVINKDDDSIVAPVLKMGTNLKWYFVNTEDQVISLATKFDVIKDYTNNWSPEMDLEFSIGDNDLRAFVGLETNFSNTTKLRTGFGLSGQQIAKILSFFSGKTTIIK